jgi:hypothetical protein
VVDVVEGAVAGVRPLSPRPVASSHDPSRARRPRGHDRVASPEIQEAEEGSGAALVAGRRER